MLTAADIRRMYIEFFVAREHRHVPSAPLVPPDDPTLMFTSAGMVQFKALYSGQGALPYRRATTAQKCLRAGGKGSDLENVGKTLRHHTFFEMLGNFSFGDYFKREAIGWAWEFCTDPKWLGLPAERIWPTVFGKKSETGEWLVDEEALGFWGETGNVNLVTRLDEKENFWGPAGETGACGPCSEIKFFMGSEAELAQYRALGAKAAAGDEAARATIANDIVEKGDLFLEIWNLVFPQYDQQMDGSRLPLRNRGIDTGLGLERTTTACQFLASGGKINTPYESDLLAPLVGVVSAIAKVPYITVAGGRIDYDYDYDARRTTHEESGGNGLSEGEIRLAMNAIADHGRALTFTLAEGIVPSNEGRGYVMRRILRRAARFGKKLGISEPFIWRLVEPVIELMGEAYPELRNHPAVIVKTIRSEEERFNRTLNQGSEILEQMLAGLGEGSVLDGAEAYKLYETYGYPLDLTIESAEERGITVDMEGFNAAQAEAKGLARASWKGGAGAARWSELLAPLGTGTEFAGYDRTGDEARVAAIIAGDRLVERLEEGQAGAIVLDRTPFYGEGGGQIGDTGELRLMIDPEVHPDPNMMTEAAGSKLIGERAFRVEDTQKTANGFYLHLGEAEQAVEVGQHLYAAVDETRRRDIMSNHSATHLLQAALKQVIGSHVTQQGSFVGPDGLRFDFTNPEAVTPERLRRMEAIVNELVRRDLPVTTAEMDLEEARRTGAIAPFGEKYGARVRVITVGEEEERCSREFCGGTHVSSTGEVGLFLIVGESSVASGVRRIEALTGRGALARMAREREVVFNLARRLSAPAEQLEERVEALQEEIRALRRRVEEAKAEAARAQVSGSAAAAVEVGGIRLYSQRIDGADQNVLSQAWDALRQRSPERTVGVFCSVAEGRVSMVAGATADIAPARVSAADLLREALARLGGKGGGKPVLARGGGSDAGKVDEVLAGLPSLLEGVLRN